jgi:hypothetical protein
MVSQVFRSFLEFRYIYNICNFRPVEKPVEQKAQLEA